MANRTNLFHSPTNVSNTFGLVVLPGVWPYGVAGNAEPFAIVQGTGTWLTREERQAVLPFVRSSEYRHTYTHTYGLSLIHMSISGHLPATHLPHRP